MKGSLFQLPLHRIRCHRTNHLSLHFHVTSAMMPRAQPTVAHSPVLRQSWETLAQLALWWSKPPNINTCPHTIIIRWSILRCKPTNLLPHGFEAQTKKPSWWFWGPNHQTIDLGFEAQTKKPSQWFWGQTTDKPSPPILRLNRETGLLVSFMCLMRIAHIVTRPPDRPTIKYPTCALSSSILRTNSPTPASILVTTRHVASVTYTSRDK
jgi:hypothetical protein